ncbi:preprotein translocase subunit YajC [Microbacterium sp. ASV49]|uniref:Preprotein translocase subunit YajC n=1 Tax=Microbacterium candidum TaxID=3041922 RepID=A0ABT7MZ79_9MICO|nr:preprotein translocase subunit YajC [Microbacterium sp. ASV49]MDL9979752.1 preprotein translocase subunit YajC [Microbacterium sp. ASV49]
MQFIQQYGLIILLAVLLVFMFWSSRRRMAKQKLEQEAKAKQTVPGAEVMLQGGLYGTIISFDPENLDQPAIVEIAPGVDIKVHSQAILRVVTPTEEPGAHEAIDGSHESIEQGDAAPHVETAEETAERLKNENDSDQK